MKWITRIARYAALLALAGCAAPGPTGYDPSKQTSPEIQALTRELSGDAPAPPRTAEGFQSAYDRVIVALLPGMGAADITQREQPQQDFQRMCFYAARPDAAPQREALCRAILARLDSRAPLAARLWMLRQLERIAGPESLPGLSALLGDADPLVAEAARRALQSIGGEETVQALLRALAGAADAERRVALLAAISAHPSATRVVGDLRRADSRAPVMRLAELTRDPDRRVALAALATLGEVAGEASISTLERAARGNDEEIRDAALAAMMRAAELLIANMQPQDAGRIYRKVASISAAPHLRTAALIGLAATERDKSLKELRRALHDEDRQYALTALRLMEEMYGEAPLAALREELSTADDALKPDLIDALGTRGDPAVRPDLLAALDSPTDAVRVAALRALGRLADPQDVRAILKRAAEDAPAREAAREALASFRGAGCDAFLLEELRRDGAADSPALAAEAIRATAARRSPEAAAAILKLAESSDETVRVAAFEALAKLAAPADLPVLLRLLTKESAAAARDAGEEAVAAVALRLPPGGERGEPVIAALSDATGSQRAALIRLLGRLQGPKALAAVRAALAGEAEIREAAIRALSRWQDAEAAGDLLSIARDERDDALQALALRGYVRLLRARADATPAQRLDALNEAMRLARRADDRRVVIGAVADVPSVDALQFSLDRLADSELREEAAVAAAKLARALAVSAPTDVASALDALGRAELSERAAGQVRDVREFLSQRAGFIGAWVCAGPYSQEGQKGPALVDFAFAPEPGGAGGTNGAVEWKPLNCSSPDDPFLFDLTKLDTQGDRCVYVRSIIIAPTDTPARLELGSDDGVKVWLNGQVVHRSDGQRPVTIGQDKIDVTLKRGENTLLLKIQQGGGGWGFICAVRDREEKPIAGLTFSAR